MHCGLGSNPTGVARVMISAALMIIVLGVVLIALATDVAALVAWLRRWGPR
jgi:hypothetical protein